MSLFRVWAPDAARVEVVVGEERRGMRRVDASSPGPGPVARGTPVEHRSGWWTLDAPDLGPGTDYGFAIDGGVMRPDPRSRWQPAGVHGPSRLVDVAGRGTAAAVGAWGGFHLPSAVLYELHVGTFSPEGTFDGAIRRLDHLVELGVTAVSLMPVNGFPGRHGWGYDGVALFAVHEPYGGPAGLARLVEACHARGLGVILDVVYNHLGPSGNYLPEFGRYFTDRYATPWGQAPNLDGYGSDEVRRFFLDNAVMWLRDYGIDGLRIDAVHAIVDTSAVHLLEEMAVEVEELAAELGRPLWLIAESDLNDPRLLWSRERGGYGLHAQWSDDFHHAVHAALTGDRGGYYEDFGGLAPIAAALREAYVYAGWPSGHRGRRHGRSAAGLSGHRFLGYLQNHDQVGNRATGDRVGHIAGPGLQKVGAALVLTSPFVPMIFQGEEWATSAPFQYFTDHEEPELANAVREGRRGEFASFGWNPSSIPDPQDPETFERSRLPWEERDRAPHADVEAWYRALIAFRRSSPSLLDGRLDRVDVAVDEEGRTLLVRRGGIIVVCNLAEQTREIPLPRAVESIRIELASEDGVGLAEGGILLPAASAAILTSE